MYKVTSFSAREVGQPLAGITSLACGGSLCIKTAFSFVPSPQWWRSSHAQHSDPGDNLGGGGAINSLIPGGVIGEQPLLTQASNMSDPDKSITAIVDSTARGPKEGCLSSAGLKFPKV